MGETDAREKAIDALLRGPSGAVDFVDAILAAVREDRAKISSEDYYRSERAEALLRGARSAVTGEAIRNVIALAAHASSGETYGDALYAQCAADFHGGYGTDEKIEIFRHGMRTVCNVLKDIERRGATFITLDAKTLAAWKVFLDKYDEQCRRPFDGRQERLNVVLNAATMDALVAFRDVAHSKRASLPGESDKLASRAVYETLRCLATALDEWETRK